MKAIRNPRELAVLCMEAVAVRQVLVSEAMERLPMDLSTEDRNLAFEITYGTFRYLPGLERVLNKWCRKSPDKLPPKLRWLLLSGVYQLIFTRVPHYAVLDECNKLAVNLGFRGLRPMVNGILRNVQRNLGEVGETDTADWLLFPWMRDMIETQYGAESLARWLDHWKDRPVAAYWMVGDEGLSGDMRSEHLPHAFIRQTAVPVDALKDRPIYVQNESSQAVAELACRIGAKSVLDLCAAPGGKSLYLKAFGQVERLVASDQSHSRVERMHANQRRLDLSFETLVANAEALEFPPESFDLVLVDAPCSAIGLIGRHPEIKYLRGAPADEQLHAVQAGLAARAWSLVKPGGWLLYAVCSLDRNEVPSAPEGAVRADEDLRRWMPAGLPCHIADGCFYFEPTGRFDGFSGMLLKKE